MPLVYQQIIGNSGKIGWWHITESYEYFENELSLKQNIKHSEKQLQFYAGRMLLKTFANINLDDITLVENNKPIILNIDFNFSISHSKNYAALYIDYSKILGLDLEFKTTMAEKVQLKFVNESEFQFINILELQRSDFFTLIWNIKEAVYKAVNIKGLSFKNGIIITTIKQLNINTFESDISVNNNQKVKAKSITYPDNFFTTWVS